MLAPTRELGHLDPETRAIECVDSWERTRK